MIKSYLCILSSLVFAFNACNGQTLKKSSDQMIMQEIQQSHLEGNIPGSDMFDSLLRRDLKKHFFAVYGAIDVNWVFLRDGPTQSGVSYPKYYLWTTIKHGDSLVSEGALRMAAVDKVRFDITDYVDIKQIKNKGADIYNIFPRSVCQVIESRLK